MKILKRILLGILFLTLLFCTSAIAQTSPRSIPANASTTADEVVARLVAEVKAGRELVSVRQEQIEALEAQIAVEQANTGSLEKSYADARREIEQLRAATGALERAIQLHEQTVAILQERDKALNKEVKKQKKRAVLATLVAVGTIASKLLL